MDFDRSWDWSHARYAPATAPSSYPCEPILLSARGAGRRQKLGVEGHIACAGARITRNTGQVRMRYTRFTGKFVIHCHILVHEDQGMMQLVEIVQ